MEKILAAMDVPVTDPLYAHKLAAALWSTRLLSGVEKMVADPHLSLSADTDRSGLQESTAVRNILKVRQLVQVLIDERGELDVAQVRQAHAALQQHLSSLLPGRHLDTVRNQHLLKVLTKLLEDPAYSKQIKLMTRPLSHRKAEQIIRETLDLSEGHPITDAHTRQAVLAAWMTTLRQTVGSCFATAPAILVHDEQPLQFLQDLNEMLSTGRLKRTFQGIEYTVPISTSWGAGDLNRLVEVTPSWSASPALKAAFEKEDIPLVPEDFKAAVGTWITPAAWIRKKLLAHFQLTEEKMQEAALRPRALQPTSLIVNPLSGMNQKGDAILRFETALEQIKNRFKSFADNALLKTWEFTFASFAETKTTFTRWNLYASLGFGPEETGGIGGVMYKMIKEKLDRSNQKAAEYQQEYEMLYSQLRYLEAKINQASTEKELQWVRVEHQSRLNEFRTFEEIRDRESRKAQRYAHLFNELVEQYDRLFPSYFQEVYDPDMHVAGNFYDDSPAGFRLLFKHGRSNTSLWTSIYTPQEYMEALAAFFVATESEATRLPEFEGLEQDLGEITTALVSHVKTHEFLESAFFRMGAAHQTLVPKKPLENLDKIEKKPWAYTSGGSLDMLVSCYFGLSEKPKQEEKWFESEIELLVFILDTLKAIPHNQLEGLSSLLMHSPTHAFLLKPSLEPLKKGWQADQFTYTWVRDYLVKPMSAFWDAQLLEMEHSTLLLELFKTRYPQLAPRLQGITSHFFLKMTSREWRDVVAFHLERGSTDLLDAFLFEMLPLTHSSELFYKLEQILLKSAPEKASEVDRLLHQMMGTSTPSKYFGRQDLFNMALSVLMALYQDTSLPFPASKRIADALIQLGFSAPIPIFFADTNWVRDYFAFLINPGTGRLELWRVDCIGLHGAPLSIWKPYLNGTDRSRTWGLYTRPFETIREASPLLK